MSDSLGDTYKRLIDRRDLVGLDDDQALEHIGHLTDLSGDLCRK
jgi:tetratricopeptide (TPR) repeat protein